MFITRRAFDVFILSLIHISIKLKALGYVEKPLDMEELASAVKEAVDSSRNEKISQAAARLQEKEQLGHLSLLLSQPGEESLMKAGKLAADLGLPITHSTCFCCIIIDCVTPLSALPEDQMDGIRDYFMEYLTSMDISQAYVLRLSLIHIYIAQGCNTSRCEYG